MKFASVAIVTALTASPVLGSLFFQESKADKIKSNLQNIGYEVLDSAGLVKDSVIENFDEQSLKDWLEAHGITDASKQTVEVAKQHKDWLLEDIKDYASQSKDFSSALLSKGKKFYEQQSNAVSDSLWEKWSDSKLKEFLDARGVEVPQRSSRDELLALVARAKYKAPVNVNGPAGSFWFDGWSKQELVNKLQSIGESVEGSRKELADRLYSAYSRSFDAGKAKGGQAADRVKGVLGDWKQSTVDSFDNWSLDDLKEYIKDFGSDVSDSKDSLVAAAKQNYYYFVHGEAPPKNFYERVTRRLSKFHSSIHGYLANAFGIRAFIRSDL